MKRQPQPLTPERAQQLLRQAARQAEGRAYCEQILRRFLDAEDPAEVERAGLRPHPKETRCLN